MIEGQQLEQTANRQSAAQASVNGRRRGVCCPVSAAAAAAGGGGGILLFAAPAAGCVAQNVGGKTLEVVLDQLEPARPNSLPVACISQYDLAPQDR